MPAPISIVIPTLNAEAALSTCLQALMEGLQAGLIRELIVTDGGSSDRTLEIANDVGAEMVIGAASRGGQLRRGCAQARGDWLLVLHADTVLQPGWSEAVAAHLPAKSPAVFRLKFNAKGIAPLWVAGWANLRTRLFSLPYGDQGLLVRKDMYLACGGFRDQSLMEDVAIARALPRITLLGPVALTSAARYERSGWLRRGARNLWTLTRYLLGADPEQLAQSYRQ